MGGDSSRPAAELEREPFPAFGLGWSLAPLGLEPQLCEDAVVHPELTNAWAPDARCSAPLCSWAFLAGGLTVDLGTSTSMTT